MSATAAVAAAGGSTLSTNQVLHAGQDLVSSGGQYKLVMQGDGNLVTYGNGAVIWASGTNGSGSNDYLVMQGDGNLVIYTSANKPVWASNTNGSGSANYLALQTDGNAVVYTSAAHAVWASGDSHADHLGTSAALATGWFLHSANGQYWVAMQSDGNFVLYTSANRPLWASNTNGTGSGNWVAMQSDGNLVVYTSANRAVWASNTNGTGTGNWLAMQNDGNLVVYTSSGHPVWASNTAQGAQPAASFVGFPTSGSCPGLGIFAARGTRGPGDPATDHQDSQINAVGYKVLAEALPGGAAGPWYDPYTAPTISTYGNQPSLNGLTASIEAGAVDLAQTVNAFYQRCPRSAVLLDGYSSGAAAIKEAYLNQLNPSAADRSRTIVVLMGDPLFNGHDAADFPGTNYAQSDNGILAQWPFAFRPQLFPQAYASQDMADVCLSGDPICNWPWWISPYGPLGPGYFGVHITTHINGYQKAGPPGSTYYFPGLAAQWAGQRYRQMVSAGMVI